MEWTGDYSDENMVRRVVLYCRNEDDAPLPRWAVVMRIFGTGSTTAADLCRRFGLNPDEMMPGKPCDVCVGDWP